MTATPPGRLNLPARPTPQEILESGGYRISPSSNNGASGPLPKGPRRSVRPSFVGSIARSTRRASNLTGLETIVDDSMKLPKLVPGIRPAYSTPLPVLPMVVLCIAMLSELLSANLCTPFLLKMVEGFFLADGREKNSETEAAVGLWTGNLVSVFFITQFFTSLLWSRIADRHGRRAVLVTSMLGSAIALMIFGTSESLPEAICVRLIQGIFGGAVGVFRGSIRDITDDTNASQAYSILGFMWGFGGVIGPILGGVFESPADNFSQSFLGHIGLFHTFPYLLPTLMAGTGLIFGAILACFLSWDGGVRGGSRIALAVEKNEPLAPVNLQASPAPSQSTAVPTLRGKRSFLSPEPEDPATSPMLSRSFNSRRDSRASLGTAYGYGGIRSKHPTMAARAALEAARRASLVPDIGLNDEPEEVEEPEPKLGFAQKFLLANEENTFNINDLWVSAAVAQDTAVFEDEDEDNEEVDRTPAEDEDEDAIEDTPRTVTPGSDSAARTGSRRVSRPRIASGHFAQRLPRLSMSRKMSTSSGQVPAIFSNTGLAETPAFAESPATSPQDPFVSSPRPDRRPAGALSVVHEGSPLVSPSAELAPQEQTSTWKLLPLLLILEYGLLAFHNTTHDQVFLSFLVTPYRSGGIGLNPASFSFLIALMCLFQLFYQFYLYPRLGPPLGQFTHLQMFRIGCIMYLPAYLTLPLLHHVTSAERPGGFIVMTLLTAITAIRYCASTLAYTSVMVLINAMSPPWLTGLTNGLAQSTVSLARFSGPVVGGSVWSASINGNPGGYSTGFYVVSLFCLIQWTLTFFIR